MADNYHGLPCVGDGLPTMEVTRQWHAETMTRRQRDSDAQQAAWGLYQLLKTQCDLIRKNPHDRSKWPTANSADLCLWEILALRAAGMGKCGDCCTEVAAAELRTFDGLCEGCTEKQEAEADA